MNTKQFDRRERAAAHLAMTRKQITPAEYAKIVYRGNMLIYEGVLLEWRKLPNGHYGWHVARYLDA